MGQSTNAILAFGFDLGEELPESLQIAMEEDEDFEWDRFLAEDSGVIYPDYGAYNVHGEYAQAEKEALAKVHIQVILHCSYDYPMYFLSIRGTEQTACRGYPRTIDTAMQGIGDQRQALKDFCTKHGIEYKEPQWYIFSMWA